MATLLLLNGCADTIALLGPASGSALSGGNVIQSTITSAASFGVKKQTGKAPLEHVKAYAEKNTDLMLLLIV